jgi:hypothetical protein
LLKVSEEQIYGFRKLPHPRSEHKRLRTKIAAEHVRIEISLHLSVIWLRNFSRFAVEKSVGGENKRVANLARRNFEGEVEFARR